MDDAVLLGDDVHNERDRPVDHAQLASNCTRKIEVVPKILFFTMIVLLSCCKRKFVVVTMFVVSSYLSTKNTKGNRESFFALIRHPYVSTLPV